MTMPWRRRVSPAAAALAAAVLLAGCAAQRAYDDGRGLVAQGRIDEGLAKLQQAAEAEPRDARFRATWLATRERVLSSYCERADQLAAQGQAAPARGFYQHALAIEPGYARARDGLAALDVQAHDDAELAIAEDLMKRGQIPQARDRIERVLAASRSNARALSLKHAIDEKTAAASPESLIAATYRKPVTVEFKDATLKQVFEVIAHGGGINFLFDKDVKTDVRTSIFLKNSTIESAIRYVLLTNQLEQQVLDGNTILIYPNNAAKQKDYQQLDVRTFYLSNAEAKSVANTLKTILKSRDVVVDERLNLVIVRDTPDAIRMAERLVDMQDQAEPEVMLDVEVIEVQRKRLQDLGIQWPASAGLAPFPLGTAIGAGSSSGTGTSSTPGLSLYDLLHQTSRTVGVSVGQFTANANVVDSDARLLTNPRIRVKNHEKAKILIGERVPNITSTATSTGFLSQSVTYIDVGLTLNVEPTVYLDDEVGIKISLEVSSLGQTIQTTSGTTAYNIGTRNATTVLRLKNGETDVLAGLIDSQERTSGNKVPGIGELPIAGRLFGATTDDDQKTEIVLSITPHLIRNLHKPDAADANFHSGTDGSLHSGQGGGTGAIVVPPPQPARAVEATPASNAAASANASASANGAAGGGVSGDAVAGGAAPVDPGSYLGAAASGGVVQVQWQGPASVAVGANVVLNVLAQANQPVASLPFTLGYDASKLQFVGVTEGPFMKQGGTATSFSSRLLTDGQLALSDSVTGGNGSAGASAQAVFATVTFKALAATPSTLVSTSSGAPAGPGGGLLSLGNGAPYTLRITAP